MLATGAKVRDEQKPSCDELGSPLAARTDSFLEEDGTRPRAYRIIAVDGDLGRSSGEWSCTDGVGACASSTVALMHTRRQHGLLAVSRSPWKEPCVFLSHLDVTLQLGESSISLATHRFPGIEPTRGYERLASFAQDPLPRWVFRGPGWELERVLGLVRGASAVVLRHAWRGARPVVLEARPLLAMRPASELTREHGGFVHSARLHANDVVVHPVRALPPVVFRHEGRFVGSPDWWRRFEYRGEQGPGEAQEDLWTPGVFRVELQPGAATHLVCGVGAVPAERPEVLLQQILDAIRSDRSCQVGGAHERERQKHSAAIEDDQSLRAAAPTE